jgi:RNA polymerase sigma factor (sigma-70 family)
VADRTASMRNGDSDDDAALIARVRAGDRAALEAIYDRYARSCYSLTRRILGEHQLAEDVVQEVFLTLWRVPESFDPARGSFSTWLLAMTHHKSVDAVRREQRRRDRRASVDVLDREATDPHEVIDQVYVALRGEQVRGAIAGLPAAQREALLLAYYGGYTQREIAELTGQPLGTVKTRMLAGMRRLRGMLAAAEPGAAVAESTEATS